MTDRIVLEVHYGGEPLDTAYAVELSRLFRRQPRRTALQLFVAEGTETMQASIAAHAILGAWVLSRLARYRMSGEEIFASIVDGIGIIGMICPETLEADSAEDALIRLLGVEPLAQCLLLYAARQLGEPGDDEDPRWREDTADDDYDLDLAEMVAKQVPRDPDQPIRWGINGPPVTHPDHPDYLAHWTPEAFDA